MGNQELKVEFFDWDYVPEKLIKTESTSFTTIRSSLELHQHNKCTGILVEGHKGCSPYNVLKMN